MRTILWFTLGFGAACAFCAYGRMPWLLLLPVLVLLAALLSGTARRYRLLLAVLGICAGLFWFSRFEKTKLEPLYELDGVTRDSVIHFHHFGEEGSYSTQAQGSILLGNRVYPVLVYLDGNTEVQPGTVLAGPFRFLVSAPGGARDSTYYQGEGIFLLAYQQDDVSVSREAYTWKDLPAMLHRRILEALEQTMPEDTLPFSKALLLGDSSDLDYATRTDFSVSGIQHIVAVSGLHVSILFGIVGFAALRRRFLSAVLGFPALLLFAAVTGFSPSVCRACIMCGVTLLASLFNREYDGPTALSFAGLALLVLNPLVIVSVSYQLSFASVAGIFAFSPGIRRWLMSYINLKKASRLKRVLARWFAVSVSVTLGATVATVPLCAMYFGTVSLVAVITNLLVLWAVSLIFYGLMGVCVLHFLWPMGGLLLGQGVSLLIRYILLVSGWIGGFPLAAVYTRSPYIVAWLVFVYGLLAVFLLGRNKKSITLGCCAVLGLCCSLLASWAEPRLDDVRFTVLDVGQGQCLLLHSEGKTYMVDCGGSSDTASADRAAETLLSQGITRLDGLFLTHYDQDHSGGAANLLHRVDAELLVLPAEYAEQDLPAGQTIYADRELLLTSGKSKIRIFPSTVPGNDNEKSLCILFDTEKCDILITGDRDAFGERMLLRHAAIPDVDVLVAGHHGSKNATCGELLAAVRPETVCISVGRYNSYGHPAPELLKRLEDFGCAVYRTDLQGDITIRR